MFGGLNKSKDGAFIYQENLERPRSSERMNLQQLAQSVEMFIATFVIVISSGLPVLVTYKT